MKKLKQILLASVVASMLCIAPVQADSRDNNDVLVQGIQVMAVVMMVRWFWRQVRPVRIY